MKADPIKAKR